MENSRFFGVDKESKERIYLTNPSWDCGWYWGLGYLGNNHCHYHLDGYQRNRNINMYDALNQDYNLAPWVKDNLWVFCELFLTAYTLRETAEMYHLGGSHMTKNPCHTLLKSPEQHKHINEVLLPAIFKEIDKLQPKKEK